MQWPNQTESQDYALSNSVLLASGRHEYHGFPFQEETTLFYVAAPEQESF